jgi:dethiobiotin synthetase
MNYFVTAIDTDSGKTIASAILCEALQADYWKPVQSGYPRDLDMVRELVTNDKTSFHKETYLFRTAASPHASSKKEGITIDLEKFNLPDTSNNIVIEGAGGCLVPLNDNDFIIDLIIKLDCEIILVSDLYLGSINHTLLTVEAIQKRHLKLKGIIFNGDTNYESERLILQHTELPCLLRIYKEDFITPEIVRNYARILQSNWQ